MRKLLLSLLLAAGLALPASAQVSKSTLNTQIDTLFPDNTTGLITPQKLRNVTKSIVASYVDWITCTGTGGIVFWTDGAPTCLPAGTNGQALVQVGGVPSWSDFAANLVAGTGITISGTSPATISITDQIVAGGPVGSGTQTPVLTYNAQGQLTAVTTTTTSPPFSAVTGQIDFTQLPTLPSNTALGNVTGGSATPVALTTTQLTTLCNTATATLKGCVPAWPNNTTTFFRGDGTYAAVPFASITGQISLTQLPTMGAGTVLANVTGAGATPTAATPSSIVDLLSGCTTQGSVLYRNATTWVCLAPGTSGNMLTTGGAGANPSWTLAPQGTVTSVGVTAGTGITQSGSPVTTSGNITVNVDKATTANYYAAASNKVPTTDVIYPAEVAVTYGATTTLDFDTFVNASVTLTGNITTLNVANVRAGKAGQIRLIQSGAGSFTWPLGGNTVFKYAGGVLPSLTTGSASAVDVLVYSCSSATFCTASLLKDVRNP